MAEEQAKRKLTAILSADVKGYSRLMADDEEATVRTINAYRDLMTGFIKDHRGRVVDAKGDNVLAEFSSVVDAVRCAVQVQKDLTERNSELPEHRRMAFRIGINLGDVIEEQGTIYGDGVNVAARLEGLAEGGGICISGTAFDHVKNRVSVGYEYQGKQSVKNIPDPVRVYKVLLEPEAVGKVIGEEEPSPRKNRWAAMAAVAVLAVVAGGLIWNFYLRPPPIEPASVEKMIFPLPEKPSIAVLPFANMSGDPQQDYLADGITENIITALSKTPKMFVIARNSTFTYKGKAVRVQQVAEEMGVRYVLEGSLQKSGDRLRINAQLIDAIEGHHLWAERYDRQMKDIFAIQDEITMKILTALEVKLTEGEAAASHAKGTDNLEAYLKDLQGREQLQKGNKDANVLARKLLEEAIALDPDFASPHVGLAYTHIMDSRRGWSESFQKSFEMADKLSQKAIALDDSLDMAHALAGRIANYKGQYDKAVSEGEKAITLGPNNAGNMIMHSVTLQYAGNPEEAVKWAEKGLRLDPKQRTLYLSFLGDAYRDAGRYEDAISTYKKVLQKDPNFLSVPIYLSAVYELAGQEKEAGALIEELLKKNPELCVESVRTSFKRLPYKDESIYAHVLEALRKAGLPETPPLPLPDKPSVAVLPFVNMSGDPEQEYFSDGITEEIITALSKTPKLFVIARNSTFTYKGKPVKVQQVGRELGVKYVLEGSVRKAEDQVRITAQLVDAQTGHHLWAERYDRSLKDIFALQDEITMKIITALQVKLTEGEQARVMAAGTHNLEAYLLYLQAVEHNMRMTKEGNVLARRMMERALLLDPNYAAAYRILANTYWVDVPLGLSKDPRQSIAKAMELLQKSVALDKHNSSGLAHSLLGWLYTLMGQHDKGISECERSVSLEPNSAMAYLWLGLVLRYAGRHKESIKMYEEAIRLNPIPPVIYYHGLSLTYCLAGQHEEAITVGKKAIRLEPEGLVSHAFLAVAYSLSGREEEARIEAREVLRINPKFSVQSWGKTMPFRNQADLELVIGALRKAGLK